MKEYNPAIAPEREEWLGLDEQLRLELIEGYHRDANVELPNVTLHATFHAIVENRIAEGLSSTIETVNRLMGAGVSRHDAVHAVASVLVDVMGRMVKSSNPDTVRRIEAKFDAAVVRLKAEDWIPPAGHHPIDQDPAVAEFERPLDELLEELALWTGRTKIRLVQEAIGRRDEITPHLLAFLQTVIADPEGYLEQDHDLLPYALILLAYFREESSFPLLLSLFRLPGDILDDLIGDMKTGALPFLLLRTCGGSLDGLRNLVTDRECNDYVRWACMEALCLAVAVGMAQREEIVSFLAGLFTGEEAEAGSHFWLGVAHVLCDLYPAEVMDVIRDAFDRGLISPREISIEDLEDAVEMGLDHAMGRILEDVRWQLPDDLEGVLRLCEFDSTTTLARPQKDKQKKTRKKSKRKMAKASRRRNR